MAKSTANTPETIITNYLYEYRGYSVGRTSRLQANLAGERDWVVEWVVRDFDIAILGADTLDEALELIDLRIPDSQIDIVDYSFV